MHFGTPLRHRARPKRLKKDPPPRDYSGSSLFGPLGPPWALQGRLLVPKGFPKITQNRHDADRSAPWGAKWAKKASRRGLRNATENLTKKVSQNCIILGCQNLQKVSIRSFKIKVLEVPKKHKKMIKNEARKGAPFHLFGALWRPLGGQGVTVRPLGVDLERVQKSVIF